ncbi:MAG: hypothetical protein JO301_06660 [Chitinophagaceae bacterium]|nr:hypothetical protein [Chitinophagaceae bacterium]
MNNPSGQARIILVFALILASLCDANGQDEKSSSRSISYSIGLPVQMESQRVEIFYIRHSIQTATILNYGIQLSANKKVNNHLLFSGGLGYFRQRFNIKRVYDHQTLNSGSDSLPIELSVSHYVYHLLEVPLGLSYLFGSNATSPGLKLTYTAAFTLASVYKGGVPFTGARTTDGTIRFFSSAVAVAAIFPFKIGSQYFSIQPFVRILYNYKKDRIFYENPSESVSRSFDAAGVNFSYNIPTFKLGSAQR